LFLCINVLSTRSTFKSFESNPKITQSTERLGMIFLTIGIVKNTIRQLYAKLNKNLTNANFD
jgi:hypothetical protein